ncbi:MAG: ParA family protein [Oscillospiraceae bacterium]|nr:ParA family protein [Oscillospiraceae bacterium]
MGKIIAIVNQKGGVGKTTTCVNLSYALHLRGKKVLLCDCDPQGNSTSGLGVDKSTSPNTYDVIMNGESPENAAVQTKFGSLLPANRELTGALIELVGVDEREFVLKKALAAVKEQYDYVFIDCPPSLELLTLNALCAADSVLVPVQCEYFALEGLTDLVATVKTVNKRLNTNLKFEGFVLTMYDSRTKLSLEVEAEIKKFFGNKVYETRIPRNVRLSEAPSHGKPVIAYDKASKGSRAYLKLASEFLTAQGGKRIKQGLFGL